jgi:cysteinyl-tRNA synthetase
MEKQELVRSALCDSFNTPSAIMEIKQLIASCNQYYMDKQKQKLRPNSSVLKKAAVYVTKMMRVFGVFMESSASIGSFVVGDSQEKDTSETLMPILKTVSKFRDTVRSLAQQKVDTSQDILRACDVLRDEELIEHGIVLEDRADSGAGALVKLVEKQLLLEQREEKKRKEEAKRLEKEERARVEEEKKRERLERGKVKPEDLFKQSDEYCEWDEKVRWN